MKKIFSILFFLFLLIVNISSQKYDDIDEKTLNENKQKFIKSFREMVKNYLTKRKIFMNESALISKDMFRTIFRDLMSGEKGGKAPESFQGTFDILTDEFVEDAFPNGKEYLKGNEVHTFFEFEKAQKIIYKHLQKNEEQNNKEQNEEKTEDKTKEKTKDINKDETKEINKEVNNEQTIDEAKEQIKINNKEQITDL